MSWRTALFGGLLIAGVVLTARPAAAGDAVDARSAGISPWYTITDLGTLGGSVSVALAVNDLGQVVGGADRVDGLRLAFLWENGVMTYLGNLAPGQTSTEAWDINDNGQIVGFAGLNAFIWENGTMTALGHLSGPAGNTAAFGINNAGQVVGISGLAVAINHAFLWENGVMTDLGTLGGMRSIAWDINSAGQVCGASFSPTGEHAFLWENGVMTDLTTPGAPGSGFSQAFGINEAGQVVGWNGQTALLWENGDTIDIGALAGLPDSDGRAINDAGIVLISGYLFDLATEELALLADLIPCDSGWTALMPRDLNNAGQVVGVGTINGRRHAFLMTPLDEQPPPRPDCQPNGIEDVCEFFDGTAPDCNANGVPDECDVRDLTSADCNGNDVPDECDIASGPSDDCNSNGIPDECDPDCNGNVVADDCEPDSDSDGTIDDCDGCPFDSTKTSPGVCGCGSPDDDADGDGVLNCDDRCPGVDDAVFGPDCEPEIPTLSGWGVAVLALTLLVGGKLRCGRRERA